MTARRSSTRSARQRRRLPDGPPLLLDALLEALAHHGPAARACWRCRRNTDRRHGACWRRSSFDVFLLDVAEALAPPGREVVGVGFLSPTRPGARAELDASEFYAAIKHAVSATTPTAAAGENG
jgi:hypothetical protein